MYEHPRVSPDGTRVAFGTSDGKAAVISIYELSEASLVRQLTFEGNNRFPVWFADSSRVAFQSDRQGDLAVFWQPAVGGIAERLTRPDPGTSHTPESWSRDGNILLFSERKGALSSLWTFSLKDRRATPFSDVKASALPANATFSNSGLWVAYQVEQAGVAEGTTYVEPFPPDGTKHLIEQVAGRPLWSRDDKELFVVPSPSRFVAVAVKTVPNFFVTSKVELPRRFGAAPPTEPRTFDILPDGRIIGVITFGQSQGESPAQTQAQQIHVVLNWFEELKSKVPTK